LKLFHDSEKAKEIEDRLIELFDSKYEVRNEVHLSDTIYCSMKCFNRLTGMIPVRTRKQKGYMILGNAGQLVVQQVYPPEQREYESTDIVSSHMDVFEDFEYPLEIKWSAKKIFRAKDVPIPWQLQLLRYMSKHNAREGWLLIMNLFSRQFIAFKMIVEADERMDEVIKMLEFKNDVLKAVEEEDPDILDIHEDECSNCDYKPSKKRRELDLGDGCPRYVRKRRKT